MKLGVQHMKMRVVRNYPHTDYIPVTITLALKHLHSNGGPSHESEVNICVLVCIRTQDSIVREAQDLAGTGTGTRKLTS